VNSGNDRDGILVTAASNTSILGNFIGFNAVGWGTEALASSL
jgi:hypothetical protein